MGTTNLLVILRSSISVHLLQGIAINNTMLKTITLCLALAIAGAATAQQPFPEITGETASGETVTLPKPDARKYTIVGVAYSQKASTMLEDWLEPAYLRFVAQHGLFAGEYDADIFFVPVFVGLNKAAYEPTLKKFKRSASPEIVDHVLFSKTDMDQLRNELGMTEKETPHFFVLNAKGQIVHRTQGAFTDDKLEGIENVLMN